MPKTLPLACQKLRERLPEYAEGTLHGAPATAIARHLITCPRCTQEVADLRAVLGVLHALPAEDLPEGLVAGITEAMGRRAPARGPAPFWSRVALPATVATGVLAVLLTLHTLEQNGDRLPGNGLMRAPVAEAPEMQPQARAGAANPRTAAPRAKAAPAPRAAAFGKREPSPSAATPSAPAQNLGGARRQVELAPAPEATSPPRAKEPSPQKSVGMGTSASGAPVAAVPAPPVPERPARGPVSLPPVDEQFATADRGAAAKGQEAGTRPRGAAAAAQDQATGSEPGLVGPARAPEMKAETSREGDRAEPPVVVAAGGRGGGGGGRAGGGRGGGAGGGFVHPRYAPRPGSRPAYPHLGRRGQRPGPYGPSRPGAGVGGRRTGRAPSGPTALPQQTAKGKPSAGPPQVALTRVGRELAVILQLSAAEGGGRLSVQVAGREAASGGGQIVLLAESAAAKAHSLPVTITSARGTRSFTLYAPSFSRLGQLQEGSALRRYRDVPLATVLSDVSRRAGLVLLVEGPTDRQVNGDLVLDSPQAAVETLAKYAGYTVRTRDAIVYTLALPEEGN